MKVHKNKSDDLCSAITRSLGICQRCQTVLPFKQLHTSHFISRKYSWTRTDLDNVTCLCPSCHAKVEHNAPMHVAWFIELRGQEVHDEVLRKFHTHAEVRMKFDWEVERSRLEGIAKVILSTGTWSRDGHSTSVSFDAEQRLRGLVRKS